MMNPVIFTLFLALLCIFCAGIGICFLKMNSSTLPFWEKLPRNRMAGSVIGTVALLCFIPTHASIFLPKFRVSSKFLSSFQYETTEVFFRNQSFSREINSSGRGAVKVRSVPSKGDSNCRTFA